MNQAEFNGRSLRVDYSEKHRTALSLDEFPRQQNTLQDTLNKLSVQESMTIFYLLQQQAFTNEEELYKIFKTRPYVLFSMLKMMHRVNSEFGGHKSAQEGLLPLPPDDHHFYPYYAKNGFS